MTYSVNPLNAMKHFSTRCLLKTQIIICSTMLLLVNSVVYICYMWALMQTRGAKLQRISVENMCVWNWNLSCYHTNGIFCISVVWVGHQWSKVHFGHHRASLKWHKVSAEGIFEDKGQLWLLSTAGDIFTTCCNFETPHVCNYVNCRDFVNLQSVWKV